MSSNESGLGAAASMPGSYPAATDPPDGEDDNRFQLVSFVADSTAGLGLPAHSV